MLKYSLEFVNMSPTFLRCTILHIKIGENVKFLFNKTKKITKIMFLSKNEKYYLPEEQNAPSESCYECKVSKLLTVASFNL